MDMFLWLPIFLVTVALLMVLVLILTAYIVTNKPMKIINLSSDAIDFIDELQRDIYIGDEDE